MQNASAKAARRIVAFCRSPAAPCFALWARRSCARGVIASCSPAHCLAVWPPSGAITLRVNVWPRKQLKTNKLLASTVQQPAPYAKRLPPTCPAVRVLARGHCNAPRRPRSALTPCDGPWIAPLLRFGLASVLHAASKHAGRPVSKNQSVTAAPRPHRRRPLEFEAAVITAFGPQALATGEPILQ